MLGVAACENVEGFHGLSVVVVLARQTQKLRSRNGLRNMVQNMRKAAR